MRLSQQLPLFEQHIYLTCATALAADIGGKNAAAQALLLFTAQVMALFRLSFEPAERLDSNQETRKRSERSLECDQVIFLELDTRPTRPIAWDGAKGNDYALERIVTITKPR